MISMLNSRCKSNFICCLVLFFWVFCSYCWFLLLPLLLKKTFDYFCLENAPTAIDLSVSTAIKKVNVISLTKKFVENIKNLETKLIASKFNDEARTVKSGQCFGENLDIFLSRLLISLYKRLIPSKTPSYSSIRRIQPSAIMKGCFMLITTSLGR